MNKYVPHTSEGGLFQDYITMFFKLKAEGSVYPSWVRNPEDKKRCVETIYAREGARLDWDSIRPNAAKGHLAKLCLNSL